MSQPKQQKKLSLVANVKSVQSGDSLVLVHPTKGIEKSVSLSNVQAPKMARRDDDKEEPFAFAAREFLRKKCIGKSVEFTFEYQSKSLRDYGTIIITEGQNKENIGVSLVREGLAKLRENARVENDNMKPYVDAQEQAKNDKKGIWADDTEKENNTRKIKHKVNVDQIAKQFKNKPLSVIVEYVISGSTLKVQTPNFENVVLNLTGIQCPGFKREVEDKKKKPSTPSTTTTVVATEGTPKNGDKKKSAVVAQPFAKDALAFTESRLLHRDVTVIIEGSERDALYGSIIKGNIQSLDKAQGPVTFQEELLSKGLARLVDWSAAKSQFVARLRAAEQEAKNQKLRVFSNYTAAVPSLQAADKNEFTARVIEFISGDTLRIRNDKTGAEERISLSSVRAQRLGRKFVDKKDKKKKDKKKKDKKPAEGGDAQAAPATTTTTTTSIATPTATPTTTKDAPSEKKTELEFEPFAMEGRELVRSKLVNKIVTVKVDYRREFQHTKVVKTDSGNKNETVNEPRRFCTVLYDGNKNIALELVQAGYASVIHHKSDEERSSAYDQLVLADSEAQKQKKGIYGSKKSQASALFNDLTDKNLGQVQNFAKILKDKKIKAVVERVYTATRFKLMLPKDGLFINFAITGIGAPSMRAKDSPDPQPFAKEALTLSTDSLLMRDVEIEIADADKVGAFVGQIWLGGSNFAETLLKNGYAYLHRSASKLKNHAMLEKLERDAETAKKNIWSNDAFVLTFRKPLPEKTSTSSNKNQRFATKTANDKPFAARITEWRSGIRFFYQTAESSSSLDKIEEIIASLNLDQQAAAKDLKEKDMCLVRYSVDNNWYRGTVIGVSKDNTTFTVKFVDFGNVEDVGAASLRSTVPDSLATIPPQGKDGTLAFIRAGRDEYVADAMDFLRSITDGKEVLIQLEYVEDYISYFTMYETAQATTSVNAQLVQDGLAFAFKPNYLFKNPLFTKTIAALVDDEKQAKLKHYGLWENGDVYGSDEDDA